MTILFGWNRFRLKTYTFEELNLPELEQFPGAKVQICQSYFHLFYIPVFPMGKRYDLVMNNELYHLPPSLRSSINPEQLRARGKWYAWLLPLLVILIGLGVYFNDMYTDHKYRQQSIEYAELQRKSFDKPMVGDHLRFSNGKDLEFQAEVFDLKGSSVMLFIDLMDMQDQELFDNIEKGNSDMNPDTLRMIIKNRDELASTSEYRDSLESAHPGQPLFTKLLTFELYKYPIKYEFVQMSLKTYQNLKRSIGDITTPGKALKIPALNKITKQRLFVSPEY